MEYALLNEDDIRLNNQTFCWPGRMDPIFEVSQHRLAAKRELVEERIKERWGVHEGRDSEFESQNIHLTLIISGGLNLR